MKQVQTPDTPAIVDRVAVKPGSEQLRDRHHAMLRSGHPREQNVGCGRFG
jgi:hypothetical protein